MDQFLWIITLMFLTPTNGCVYENVKCITKTTPPCFADNIQLQPSIQPIRLPILHFRQPVRSNKCKVCIRPPIYATRPSVIPAQSSICTGNQRIVCKNQNRIIMPNQYYPEISKSPIKKPICNICNVRKQAAIQTNENNKSCVKSHPPCTSKCNCDNQKLPTDSQQSHRHQTQLTRGQQIENQQFSNKQSQTIELYQSQSKKFPSQQSQSQDIQIKQSQTQRLPYGRRQSQTSETQIEQKQNQNYPLGQSQFQQIQSRQSQTQQYRNGQSQTQQTQVRTQQLSSGQTQTQQTQIKQTQTQQSSNNRLTSNSS